MGHSNQAVKRCPGLHELCHKGTQTTMSQIAARPQEIQDAQVLFSLFEYVRISCAFYLVFPCFSMLRSNWGNNFFAGTRPKENSTCCDETPWAASTASTDELIVAVCGSHASSTGPGGPGLFRSCSVRCGPFRPEFSELGKIHRYIDSTQMGRAQAGGAMRQCV